MHSSYSMIKKIPAQQTSYCVQIFVSISTVLLQIFMHTIVERPSYLLSFANSGLHLIPSFSDFRVCEIRWEAGRQVEAFLLPLESSFSYVDVLNTIFVLFSCIYINCSTCWHSPWDCGNLEIYLGFLLFSFVFMFSEIGSYYSFGCPGAP